MEFCPQTLHCRGSLAESLPRKRGFLLEFVLCSHLLHSLAALVSKPENIRAGGDPRAFTAILWFLSLLCLLLFVFILIAFPTILLEFLVGKIEWVYHLSTRIEACKVIFHGCIMFHQAHVSWAWCFLLLGFKSFLFAFMIINKPPRISFSLLRITVLEASAPAQELSASRPALQNSNFSASPRVRACKVASVVSDSLRPCGL